MRKKQLVLAGWNYVSNWCESLLNWSARRDRVAHMPQINFSARRNFHSGHNPISCGLTHHCAFFLILFDYFSFCVAGSSGDTSPNRCDGSRVLQLKNNSYCSLTHKQKQHNREKIQAEVRDFPNSSFNPCWTWDLIIKVTSGKSQFFSCFYFFWGG